LLKQLRIAVIIKITQTNDYRGCPGNPSGLMWAVLPEYMDDLVIAYKAATEAAHPYMIFTRVLVIQPIAKAAAVGVVLNALPREAAVITGSVVGVIQHVGSMICSCRGTR